MLSCIYLSSAAALSGQLARGAQPYAQVEKPAVAMNNAALLLLWIGSVSGDYYAIPERATCTTAQRQQIKKHGVPFNKFSNCPKLNWVDWFATERECGVKQAHILVIGGNKGFDCVGWLRMYRNTNATDDWKPSAKEWLSVLPASTTCGQCKQCESEYPLPKRRKLSELPPTVTCVEPLPANFDGLSAAAQTEPWASSGLRIIHAAAALDTSRKVTFPANAKWGREDIGIDNHGQNRLQNPSGEISVATKTVDQLVFGDAGSNEQPKIPTVLTIDTEGFDALVLFGAARTLSSGGVAYLEFEYHGMPPWKDIKLKWIIDYLNNFHFDCYFAGNDGLAFKVTGCWQEKYEFHKWSNLACASRMKIEPHTCWHDAIEHFSAVDGCFNGDPRSLPPQSRGNVVLCSDSAESSEKSNGGTTVTRASTETPQEGTQSDANQNAAGSPRQFLGLKSSH